MGAFDGCIPSRYLPRQKSEYTEGLEEKNDNLKKSLKKLERKLAKRCWRDPILDPPKKGSRVLVIQAGTTVPSFANIEVLHGDRLMAVLESYPEQYNKRALEHLEAWFEIPKYKGK